MLPGLARAVAARHLAAAASIRAFATAAAGSEAPLRFCVVGSGPAGFYTADKLLKRFGEEARVDIVEALPTPFGLVRSGVAPDHADTKNVINQFTALAAGEPRLRFFGNVCLGADASLAQLRALYHGVVLAYGAESDRQLGVPGEDLPGVLSAREFVWWYNGHPAYASLPVDLRSVRSVAIAGLGNVAVDCARVLLQPPERLAGTDIAEHALEVLRHSAVEEVHLIGRRGPVQAAFTPKELREMLGLEGVRVVLDPGAFALSEACQGEMKATRMKKRVHDLLAKALQEPKEGAKSLHIHFLRTPAAVLPGPDGAVAALRLERTALRPGREGGEQRAEGTGECVDLPAQLILRSIGFKSVGLEGVPFDARRGVVPNQLGQVLAEDGATPEPGLFVCGWLKRGPTGIIGTNLMDAEQTVDTIVRARDSLPAPAANPAGGKGLAQLLQERGVQVVSFADWQKIDAAEVAAGQARGKPREKLVDVGQMLQVARS